jgi:hypothetical protein
MHCEHCWTFEHQLRHYEMEIRTRIGAGDNSQPGFAGMAIGESLDDLKEGLRKTQALYLHHRERVHSAILIPRDSAGAAE